jgi:hypothetical protein
LKSMGYELSRSNYDYKQGDKLVFKRKWERKHYLRKFLEIEKSWV